MITDEHKAFARAVVALARQMGMDGIVLRYRHASRSTRSLEGMPVPNSDAWNEVTASWHSGPHDCTSSINITADTRLSIPETKEGPGAPRAPSNRT